MHVSELWYMRLLECKYTHEFELSSRIRNIVYAYTRSLVHACTRAVVHAHTRVLVHDCTRAIVHAFTIDLIHACTRILEHSC